MASCYVLETPQLYINSLAPGKFEWNYIYVIFKWILVIDGWGISCEIVLLWMSLDFNDDHSTLVQVMAWCRQATSHYLSQCWPSSLSPYGITRPQWVNPCVLDLTHGGPLTSDHKLTIPILSADHHSGAWMEISSEKKSIQSNHL